MIIITFYSYYRKDPCIVTFVLKPQVQKKVSHEAIHHINFSYTQRWIQKKIVNLNFDRL